MVKIKIRKTLFVFLLIVFIAGCTQKDRDFTEEEPIEGIEGITIEFLTNCPQNNYLVSDNREPISVMLNVRNKGTFPKEDEQNALDSGEIYLSGFDYRIIDIESSKSLSGLDLPAASSLYPEGGFDIVGFDGEIITDNIMVDRYEPIVLATICYPYSTELGTSVCIDPFPFDKSKKVCEMGSQTFANQGAPVAITRIDQEASTNKIQFKITIKNAGDGEIIELGKLGACDPLGSSNLERNDFDKVILESMNLGTMELLSECEPFAEGSNNLIRLHDGEGFIICSVDMLQFSVARSAYTTPLNIRLKYGYKSTVSKQIKISKFTSVS